MTINVVSETITTHEWESNVLAPAFSAITGINFTHTLIGEAMLSNGCRHRCRPARTCLTSISTTLT
jgi:hypothetical protein